MATCPNKNLQEWKDLVAVHGEDMAYFLWDQAEGNIAQLQIEGTESTEATPLQLNQIKEAAAKMGIRFNTLLEYVKEHPEIDASNTNALADLLRGVVAIAEGKENVALTEEVVHIATAIMEQTNPSMITALLSQINKYQIYQDTLKAYRNNKNYQTSDGKPDIRKIKKEALDKLLVEVILRGQKDLNAFPELAYAENLNWFQKIWEDIKQAIRALHGKSDINLLGQVAAKVAVGEVGGTIVDTSDIEIGTPSINHDNYEADLYDIKINGKYAGYFSITKRKGYNALPKDKVGFISGSFSESGVELDPEFRGQGYGVKVYIALAKVLAKEGVTLKSEFYGKDHIGEKANNVWQSLVKRGLAVDKGGYYEVTNNIYLQTVPENTAVNTFYDSMWAMHDRLEVIPEVLDSEGNVISKRYYKLDGTVDIAQSVTEKIAKNKDFKDLPDSKEKMMWGQHGHDYVDQFIKNNLIDENGYKKTPTNTRIASPLNGASKAALESFAKELIDSYPPGTRFLTEVKVVNTEVKGGLASTIDFMAIMPTKDSAGNDTFNVDVLDWKFTSFNRNQYFDLSFGKQKAWKMQMGEYVKMLKSNTYKVPANSIKKARMIPFIADYAYAIPGVYNSGLVLSKVEIGKLDNPNETRLYLMPVPTDEESVGNDKIDQLIQGLEKQQKKMYKKLRSVKQREEKDAEMATIQAAIKKLRVQLDFDPLYSVGRNLTKRIADSLKAYKNLDIDKLTKIQFGERLGELIDFQVSLEKFITLREIYSEFVNKDDDQLTPEERSTLAKINSVTNMAITLSKQIEDIQNSLVVDKAVELGEVTEANKEDILKPDAAVNDMAYNFMEGSRLPSRIIRMASNMMLQAASLVNLKVDKRIKKFGSLLNELEKVASSLGVKAFDLIGEVNDKDLSLINKIKKEYYEAQREAIKNKDAAFFKRNMDIPAYKRMVHEIIKERNAIIDETIFTSDVNENKKRREAVKESFKNKINIFSKDFYGYDDSYFLYIYKQNFLEELHYSDKFKQLKSNDAAYKVWQFFMELNAEARDHGYLDREKQSFFPLMEATSLQKLQQTKNYTGQAVDFFKDVYLSRINETYEYNRIDPETGEVKKSIPKYFTKTDKNVEQLSRDLNMVGAAWIRAIENYKSKKELENVLLTMHTVEKAKGSIVTDAGKTVYDGTRIVTKDDANHNAELLQKIIDDYIYSLKESTTSIGNTVINMGASKFSRDEETQERYGINTRKTIESANGLVRLLALGLKVPLGVANWMGTQFQSLIKAGNFYTFKQYEKAHAKVAFSDLGTLSFTEKAALHLFVPLNDDTALEARRKVAKEQGLLKYLSTWGFTDTLMLTMQFPEKKLQFANALAILDNTIVIDGKLENARQYIKRQDRLARKNGADFSERTSLRKTQEERIKALIEEKGIHNYITATDEEISIPGVTDEEIARYRTLIIDYNRTLNGMMDENDKMGFRRDTLMTSFMMFKSWIPKLVYVRTGKLEKNLQTGEWDYGRMRAFLKTVLYKDLGTIDIEAEKTKSFVTRWNMNVFAATKRLKDILYMTDDGIALINNILYDKKLRHLKETGQQLEITEEEFQDVIRDAVVGQFKELGVLFTIMGSYVAAAVAEPPEDASDFEKNRYKWIYRQINKIGDEITFYYLPGSTQSMLQGTFIPAVGLISRVERFGSQLGKEAWGNITEDADMVKDAHPTKYLFNLIPILSQAQNEFLPYIDPELAKEMGIRVTKESRKN